MNRIKKWKLPGLFVLLFLCSAFLTACGGSGGGDGNAAKGSTWDKMVWDEGKWG